MGDLAQFMVQNGLDRDALEEQCKDGALSLPQSVVEYLQGYLGVPEGGFPEPLRSNVLRGKTLPGSEQQFFVGRPGAELPDYDFAAARAELEERYGSEVPFTDVLSHVMYPDVYAGFRDFVAEFGDVSVLETRAFIMGLSPTEEAEFQIEEGKKIFVKLLTVDDEADEGGFRKVWFELNGHQRMIKVQDEQASSSAVQRELADPDDAGSIGAPMPGVVVDVRVKKGDALEVGDPTVVLSAMKMETVVAAPISGVVSRVVVDVGDSLSAGELVLEMGSKDADD